MVYRKSIQFDVSQGIVRTFGGRERFCWVQRSQLMFEVPAFSAHTGSESLTPLVDSAVDDSLIEPVPLFTTLLSRKTGLLV